MSSIPLISIILPVYNVEKFIEKSYQSILKQKFDNIEIIYVNDGSTDNSKSVIENLKLSDHRISLIDKKNEGVGIARNVGLQNANGKYIYFMDPDDFLLPCLIDDFVEIINNNNKTEIYIFGYQINKNNKITIKTCKEKKDAFLDLKKDLFDLIDNSLLSPIWNKIYSKDFLNSNHLLYKNQKNGQDVLFNVDAFLNAKYCYLNNNIYYEYNIFREGSLTEKYYDKRFYDRINVIESTDYLFEVLECESHSITRNKAKIIYALIDELRNLKNSDYDLIDQKKDFKEKLSLLENEFYREVSYKDLRTLNGKISMFLLKTKQIRLLFYLRNFL